MRELDYIKAAPSGYRVGPRRRDDLKSGKSKLACDLVSSVQFRFLAAADAPYMLLAIPLRRTWSQAIKGTVLPVRAVGGKSAGLKGQRKKRAEKKNGLPDPRPDGHRRRLVPCPGVPSTGLAARPRCALDPDAASLAFERANRLPPESELAPAMSTYELPLRTRGRDVVDARGRRVKLASVNWYGASDELFASGGLDARHRDDIARLIRRLGFNSVRLPYSDELVTSNPIVRAADVAANPDLIGLSALEVFHATVRSLTGAGIAVIVNNHITRASWCDGFDLCDASWKNDHLGPLCPLRQTEEDWIRHWEAVVAPLADDPLVIGVDLRNEVRGLWGTMSWDSWAAAAERAGDRLLALNPDWLIIVGGTSSGNDLSGGRYATRSYESFVSTVRRHWGYLLEGDIAPVWVGEFGAPARPGVGDARYWRHLVRYLKVLDADFGYWALNPRKMSRDGSSVPETYGLVEEDWKTPVLDYRMKSMIELMRDVADSESEDEAGRGIGERK
ncbi:unnamed protein product [Parascedosporium putredinis]|uniref:Glycoside hydrolase family 5 domain-containing protein n=1 Tax=Parascedosporium putredinis TaxID=1442378 RepID=A0A9P1MAI4_9PEZI|nr:unnamed protein product [Parascedosporium putredinis]CAI7992864.1 unnamed protein product [Parascedosporium putredinis]